MTRETEKFAGFIIGLVALATLEENPPLAIGLGALAWMLIRGERK